MPRPRVPSYRRHKARDCAVVTLAGRDHYLGPYDSPESWEAYRRLVAEHLARREQPPPPAPADAPLTVAELIARYWSHVTGYYVKGGRPTSEVAAVKLAVRFVRRLYGTAAAAAFTPKCLAAVREAMVAHPITRRVKVVDPATGGVGWADKPVRQGLARTTVNKLVGRVRRMFRWAVEQELVPVAVHDALLRLPGLKRGKSAARETARVRPVPDADVDAVLPHLPPAVADMVRVQRLCGCRPQEVVLLRPGDLDRSGPVWEYRPARHKTEHHNDAGDPDRDRVVYLGPQAQAILAPLLPAAADEYVFSPARSEAARGRARRANRASPLTPSQAARRPKGRAKAPLGACYSVGSYRTAVRRACRKAGVPAWAPNQLRYSRLTDLRKRFGLEASRVVGGHREVGVTQHYAEQDRTLARQVMTAVG